MSFNPDQTVKVTFSNRMIPADHPPLFSNDVAVMKVDEHKYHGVLLDSQLTFSCHIPSAINKARCGINKLWLLFNYFPRQTLNELYNLYDHSHLDYGDVIYYIPQKIYDFRHEITLHRQMERLESVHYSAGLGITGAWKGTSRDKIYKELSKMEQASRSFLYVHQ